MNYFSSTEQKKFCSSCQTIQSLKKFRVVNFEREPDQSSRYCSHCRHCENNRAKLNHKARKQDSLSARIEKVQIQISRYERKLALLLKEKQ